jgi:hypothetical protein
MGALGSVSARFFHPGAKIHENLPNDTKKRLENVLCTGKELHYISRKDQLVCEYRIPEFDDGTVFHTCVNNFQVDKAPIQPFADEVHPAAPSLAPALAPDPDYDARSSTKNPTNNIGQGASEEGIAELRRQGIEIENEDCAPNNLPQPFQTSPTVAQVRREWITSTTCPRMGRSKHLGQQREAEEYFVEHHFLDDRV